MSLCSLSYSQKVFCDTRVLENKETKPYNWGKWLGLTLNHPASTLFSSAQLCPKAFLRYGTLGYSVCRKSWKAFMDIFPPFAEDRQPVWMRLWFTLVARLGLMWLVLFQCEAFLPFGQAYIHLTIRIFENCVVLSLSCNMKITFFVCVCVLILCPLYPNTQMTGHYVWVGCMRRVGRPLGQGFWLLWVRLMCHPSHIFSASSSVLVPWLWS